jgi:acetyltransferase-like isoleucine patch superfamily enzyme
LRRDHKPYYLKKLDLKIRDWYVRHFLEPQFTHLGENYTFMKPWHVELFGEPIELGDYANVITTPDHKVRLTIWSNSLESGGIKIGNYCLLCPGLRIQSASGITIGNNCMMASNSYITDSDWHEVYDRADPVGKSAPVKIGNNVWIGDGAIVCKGVTIGDNSVIGARAVVVRDIPPNSIAAGNPAEVVNDIDPEISMRTRADWFSEPNLSYRINELDREMLEGNTLLGWLRSLLFPVKED